MRHVGSGAGRSSEHVAQATSEGIAGYRRDRERARGGLNKANVQPRPVAVRDRRDRSTAALRRGRRLGLRAWESPTTRGPAGLILKYVLGGGGSLSRSFRGQRSSPFQNSLHAQSRIVPCRRSSSCKCSGTISPVGIRRRPSASVAIRAPVPPRASTPVIRRPAIGERSRTRRPRRRGRRRTRLPRRPATECAHDTTSRRARRWRAECHRRDRPTS